MKKGILFVALAATVMFAACGSNKKTASTNPRNPFGGETFTAPCQELDSDSEFGATGIYKGSANQLGDLQLYALQNAQQMVRRKLQHVYKGMVSDFNTSYGGNAGNDIMNKMTSAGDQAINAVINDTRATCIQFSEVDDKGNSTCFVGIRISKQAIAKEVANRVNNVLSEDEKMRIRFEEKKYREEYEQRMRNFNEQ
ncbi:MAG: hypothetical protein J6I49_05830 [Bacteroidales bacterium]|nr:hypothetical protein [Bacteroidales bacterium]